MWYKSRRKIMQIGLYKVQKGDRDLQRRGTTGNLNEIRGSLAVLLASLLILVLIYTSAKAQIDNLVLYPGLSPQVTTLPNPDAPQWPWMMFHDWTSGISTGLADYTNAEVAQIAALNAGLWNIRYIYTTNGQLELARILAVNPDFKIMAYFKHTHAPVADIDNDDFPFWGAYDDIVSDDLALDTAASAVIAWSALDTEVDNWVDLMPGEDSKTYRKTTVLDEIVALFKTYLDDEATWPIDPIWIQLDYINKVSQGYNVFTGGAALDMDQDATVYASDAGEIAAYTDFQNDFLTELQGAMGADFRIMVNGNAGYPVNGEITMMGKAHGATMENFPDLPGAVFNDGDTINQLKNHYNNFFINIPGQFYTVLYLDELQSLTNTSATHFANANRACSMIWLVPWTRLADGGASPPIVFVDPQRDTWAPNAGQPVAHVKYSTTAAGVRTFSREFQGGVAKIEISANDLTITATWVAN